MRNSLPRHGRGGLLLGIPLSLVMVSSILMTTHGVEAWTTLGEQRLGQFLAGKWPSALEAPAAWAVRYGNNSDLSNVFGPSQHGIRRLAFSGFSKEALVDAQDRNANTNWTDGSLFSDHHNSTARRPRTRLHLQHNVERWLKKDEELLDNTPVEKEVIEVDGVSYPPVTSVLMAQGGTSSSGMASKAKGDVEKDSLNDGVMLTQLTRDDSSSQHHHSFAVKLNFSGSIRRWYSSPVSPKGSATAHHQQSSLVAGPSAFVSAKLNGEGGIFFVSMCAMLGALPFELTGDVVLKLDPESMVFQPYWQSADGKVTRNATCHVTDIGTTASNVNLGTDGAIVEALVIAGGYRYAFDPSSHSNLSGLAVDLFFFQSLRYLRAHVQIPMGERNQFLTWPVVTSSSSTFLIVGGGLLQSLDRSTGRLTTSTSNLMFSVSLFLPSGGYHPHPPTEPHLKSTGTSTSLFGSLPSLPSDFYGSQGGNAVPCFPPLAVHLFETALFAVNLQEGTVGSWARMDLGYTLLDAAAEGRASPGQSKTTMKRSALGNPWGVGHFRGGKIPEQEAPAVVVSPLLFGTVSGDRGTAQWKWGMSIQAVNTTLDTDGTSSPPPLSGSDEDAHDESHLTYTVIGTAAMNMAPASLVAEDASVYYQMAMSVSVSATNATEVIFPVEPLGMKGGILALSPNEDCRGRHVERPFEGKSEVSFYINFTVVPQLYQRCLYLCYSSGVVISWPSQTNSPGSAVITTVYSPMNPQQPFWLELEYTTPSPHNQSVNRPYSWTFYALVALGAVIIVALFVAVGSTIYRIRMAKAALLAGRIGAGSGSSSRFGQDRGRISSSTFSEFGSKEGETSDAFFQRLQVSTSSHSARYEMLKSLTAPEEVYIGPDDIRSHHTFLVRRRKDKTLFVLKYYKCQADIDRLAAMHEFEMMQMMQQHRNVVLLVDMFMSYTFGENRDQMGPSISPRSSSTNQRPASGISPSVSDHLLNGESSRTFSRHTYDSTTVSDRRLRRSSKISGFSEFHPTNVSTASRGEHRYLCMVTEYHPLGNLASWCSRYATKVRHVDEDMSTTVPEEAILSVGEQLLSLLYAMHKEYDPPLLHRGIRPENILVTAAPKAHQSSTHLPIAVSDFGMSSLGHYAPPPALIGTAYGSSRTEREFESGKEGEEGSSSGTAPAGSYTPKSDVWCVGCVLLSMALLRFGNDFPELGTIMQSARKRSYEEKILDDIVIDVRARGYSRELCRFIRLLLSRGEKERPSAESLLQYFYHSAGTYRVSLVFPSGSAAKERRE